MFFSILLAILHWDNDEGGLLPLIFSISLLSIALNIFLLIWFPLFFYSSSSLMVFYMSFIIYSTFSNSSAHSIYKPIASFFYFFWSFFSLLYERESNLLKFILVFSILFSRFFIESTFIDSSYTLFLPSSFYRISKVVLIVSCYLFLCFLFSFCFSTSGKN